jgi:transcriptional regulator with XRE-family HTH domain
MSVKTRITELLELRGMSPTKLNSRSGLSAGYLSRVLSGHRDPERVTLEILAVTLGTNFDYLARGTGPKDGIKMPAHWGWSRAEVGGRVLIARGHPAADAEAAMRVVREDGWPEPAGDQVADELGPAEEKMPSQRWVQHLEAALDYLKNGPKFSTAGDSSYRPRPKPSTREVQEKATWNRAIDVARAVSRAVAEELGIPIAHARAATGMVALDEEEPWSSELELYRAVMKLYGSHAPSRVNVQSSLPDGLTEADLGLDVAGENKGQGGAHPVRRPRAKGH